MTPLKTGGELWCSGRVIIQEKLEDTKGTAANQRKTAKRKGQTMIYKILYRKLKIEQHEPHKKLGCEVRCSGRVSSSSYS
jgi:hypothetical protein